jgi:hypothetical protein
MSIPRIFGLVFFYMVVCIGWMILAAVTSDRSSTQKNDLREQVSALWGEAQAQSAPRLNFRAVTLSAADVSASRVISPEEAALLGLEIPKPPAPPAAPPKTQTKTEDAPVEPPKLWAVRGEPEPVALEASTVDAALHSDPRRKGLVWYSLYDVHFSGEYAYQHRREESGYLDIEFTLPTQSALYDQLVFQVDGKDQRASLDPTSGTFRVAIAVRPNSVVRFGAGYASRGADVWSYVPGNGVQQLENFRMTLATDFRDINFPAQTLSPTDKVHNDNGWNLTWDFKSTVTGRGMGLSLPEHIQPGELSTAMTLSAPVSLMFYFVMLFVLATLRKLDIHPINYFFLGCAFFAFHLLFSYSADHLTVPWAFGIASAVSMVLVVSYLRLVVSPMFALREAALGQLVYLIGFSLAHFWKGYTGLTITVLAIITLFILMQATGRLRWSEVLARKSEAPKPPPPPPPVPVPVVA